MRSVGPRAVARPALEPRSLRLAHALGIDRPRGCSQHEGLHLARAAQRILHRRPAAHRLGDDADSGSPDARSRPPDRRHSRQGRGRRQWPRRGRTHDARRSRRCSGTRSARPAATTTYGCRRARARTAVPAHARSPHSGSCSPALAIPDATNGDRRQCLMLVPWRIFGSGFLDNSSMASARCSSAML